MSIFLLAVDSGPYLVYAELFDGRSLGVNLAQVLADAGRFAPFDGPVQARVVVAIIAGHHIVVRVPIHLFEQPGAVPDYHLSSSPGQVGREYGSYLYVLKCGAASYEFARKLNGVFRKIGEIVIDTRPFD